MNLLENIQATNENLELDRESFGGIQKRNLDKRWQSFGGISGPQLQTWKSTAIFQRYLGENL